MNKTKITRKTREQAAMMASACACAGEHQHGVLEEGFSSYLRTPAWKLVVAAFYAARVDIRGERSNPDLWRFDWAEAEALIQTGWMP